MPIEESPGALEGMVPGRPWRHSVTIGRTSKGAYSWEVTVRGDGKWEETLAELELAERQLHLKYAQRAPPGE